MSDTTTEATQEAAPIQVIRPPDAFAVRVELSAVTMSTERMLSVVIPYLRAKTPMPPPSARPAMPTVGHDPPGSRRPRAPMTL